MILSPGVYYGRAEFSPGRRFLKNQRIHKDNVPPDSYAKGYDSVGKTILAEAARFDWAGRYR